MPVATSGCGGGFFPVGLRPASLVLLKADENSMVAKGSNEPGKGTIVDIQAGGGVMRVSLAVMDALLAVTVTENSSVTVK